VDPLPKPTDKNALADRILTSRDNLVGERKYVTVLFADVVGSTAAMAGLDPEDARELIEPTVLDIVSSVKEHGGTVCKIMGDGLMALFGAPVAQEDHAIRACSAALEVLGSSKRSAGIRFGLHCGEVVLIRSGSDVQPDYDAIGDAVNLAARLEQQAETNSAIVSHDVLRAASGLLEVEALAPMDLKGFAPAITAYDLKGIQEREIRQDRQTRNPFVGRSRELRILQSLLDDASDGVGQLASITGDAGTGKSRLAFEIIRLAKLENWRVVYAAGAHTTRMTADSAIARVLVELLDLPPEQTAMELQQHILGWFEVNDEQATSLCKSISLLLGSSDLPNSAEDPSNVALRKHATQVFQVIVQKLCRQQPLLIVIDNLRLLDSSSRSVLEQLLSNTGGDKLVVVTLSRSIENALQVKGAIETRHLRLVGLSDVDAGAYFDMLVGNDSSLLDLRQPILEKAGNNPFFIEEIVESLVDQGALAGPFGDRVKTRVVAADQIPANIFTTVGARIDHLHEDQRRILQSLSVLNDKSDLPTLQGMTGLTAEAVQRNLDALQEGGFVSSDGLLSDYSVEISHNIVRDVAYRSLLRNERQHYHSRAYACLLAASESTCNQGAQILGHHAFEATEFDTAAIHLLEAGKVAYRRSAHSEAVDLLQRALRAQGYNRKSKENLAAEIDTRLELRNALFALGKLEEVQSVLTLAGELAEQIDDKERNTAVHTLLIHHHLSVGEQKEALFSADKALGLAEAAQNARSILNARFYKTQIYASLGRYRDAVAEAEWVLTSASNQTGADRDWARTITGLTGMWRIWCAAELGQFEDATAHVVRAQNILSNSEGSEHSTVDLLWAGLGCGLFWLRRGLIDAACLDLAADTLKQTLNIARARKVDTWIAAAASPLSLALTLGGDPATGTALAREAVDRSPSRQGAGHALRWVHLGRAELALGELSDAEEHCELGLSLARRSGEAGHEAYALQALGLLAVTMERVSTPD